MLFVQHIARDASLRKDLLKAMIIAGGIFFVFQLVSDCLIDFGSSSDPVIQQDVEWNWLGLLGRPIRTALISAFAAGIGVYVCWIKEGNSKQK